MRDQCEASMWRHPSGRIARLIEDGRDQQAMDVANRTQVDLEAWSGGPLTVPESDEVRRQRAANEETVAVPSPRDLLRVELAVTVREVREWDGWPHTRWMLKVLVSVLALWMIVMILGVTIAAGYVGQIAGGWPL